MSAALNTIPKPVQHMLPAQCIDLKHVQYIKIFMCVQHAGPKNVERKRQTNRMDRSDACAIHRCQVLVKSMDTIELE